MNLEMIYEDNCIMVAYKPAGLATQTNRLGQQDMVSLLRNYLAKNGQKPYVGLVHRLDQPVEGVMVFAKTEKAAADLSKQVKDRTIGKHYLAVCTEAPDPRQGTLEDQMVFDKKNNLSYLILEKAQTKEAQQSFYMKEETAKQRGFKLQKASLDYQVKQVDEKGLALVDIKLNTGRHHQIRLQFAGAGCPLAGDKKYGSSLEKNQNLSADERLEATKSELFVKNVALCSYCLEFVHPETKEEMKFEMKPKGELFQKLMD